MDKLFRSERTPGVRSKKRKISRVSASGQSLVEYALILVFVSIAVLVVASLIGLAVQRIYGVVGGTLGGSHNTPQSSSSDPLRYLAISSANCFLSSVNGGNTSLVVRGEISDLESVADPNYDVNISTDTGIIANRQNAGANATIQINGQAGGVLYVKQLTTGTNASACPHSVTVQTKDLIAVSPVTVLP